MLIKLGVYDWAQAARQRALPFPEALSRQRLQVLGKKR